MAAEILRDHYFPTDDETSLEDLLSTLENLEDDVITPPPPSTEIWPVVHNFYHDVESVSGLHIGLLPAV